MAAVIPEAAEAVTSGTSAVRGASEARRARSARPVTRPVRTAPPQPGRSELFHREARDRVKREAQSAGRRVVRARVPGNRRYQPAILAEFLVAILITAVAPIAQGGDKTAQAKGGPSPYSGDTLKQLVAIGAAYFILAILSGSQKYGRLAAWFGGLILLAVGLNSFVTGGLTAIFGIFGPSPLASPADATGAELGVAGGPTAADIANATGQAFGPELPSTQQAQQQQFVTFTQPGVITSTEASPGASLNTASGILGLSPSTNTSTGANVTGTPINSAGGIVGTG